jgi:hypothetical protein
VAPQPIRVDLAQTRPLALLKPNCLCEKLHCSALSRFQTPYAPSCAPEAYALDCTEVAQVTQTPATLQQQTPANTFSSCFKYCTLTVHSTTSKEPSPQRLSSCSRMHTTLLHPQTCSRTTIAASPSWGETLPGQNSKRSKPLRAQLQGDPFLGCHFPQPLNAIAIGDASLTLQPF